MAEPRYTNIGNVGTVCEDCGVIVAIREAHTRFHSILSTHAWCLAAHIAAHVHDKYEADDSWSGDALADVMKEIANEP